MSNVLSRQALLLAERSLFSRLQVVEFWMPQFTDAVNCNLKCGHCYVPTVGPRENMTTTEYLTVLEAVMEHPAFPEQDGRRRWDVVFPGMEPLLPRNIPLLRTLVERADALGARSIGVTTNGTLFQNDVLEWLAESPVINVNVSIDGTKEIHDLHRGEGFFEKTARGLQRLNIASRGRQRVITNTTITALNAGSLYEVADISTTLGCDYASFHPFEAADNAQNTLFALPREKTVAAAQRLVEQWEKNPIASISLEFEASTAGVFFALFGQGIFRGWEVLSDVTDFLFLRKESGSREFLMSIMFMPHHFIRTLRVNPDGGLSSCRQMALRSWDSIGDLRNQSLDEIKFLPETTHALARIWQEYIDSTGGVPVGVMEDYFSMIKHA